MLHIFTDYAQIEQQIEALEAQKAELKKVIIHHVKENGGPIKTEVGSFSRVVYEVWEFSDSLIKTEKKYKEEISKKKEWAKMHNQARRVAQNESLRFSAKKGD